MQVFQGGTVGVPFCKDCITPPNRSYLKGESKRDILCNNASVEEIHPPQMVKAIGFSYLPIEDRDPTLFAVFFSIACYYLNRPVL